MLSIWAFLPRTVISSPPRIPPSEIYNGPREAWLNQDKWHPDHAPPLKGDTVTVTLTALGGEGGIRDARARAAVIESGGATDQCTLSLRRKSVVPTVTVAIIGRPTGYYNHD